MPNSSSMTTTSPRAINVPLTNTSTGAPAARSRSMTAPGVIESSSRTVMRHRPSSAVTPISTSASTYEAPVGRAAVVGAADRALRCRRPVPASALSWARADAQDEATRPGRRRRARDTPRGRRRRSRRLELGVGLGGRAGLDVDDGLLADRACRGFERGRARRQQDLVGRGPFERLGERRDRDQRDRRPVPVRGREVQRDGAGRLLARRSRSTFSRADPTVRMRSSPSCCSSAPASVNAHSGDARTSSNWLIAEPRRFMCPRSAPADRS